MSARREVAVVSDTSAADALRGEWDELADSCGAGPLTLPSYALSWWRHLGRGRLAVVTVRERGTLVALAPLHVRRIAGIDMLRWLGHGLGTVAEVLVRPGCEDAAADVWEAVAGSQRALQLVEYRDDGGGVLALRRSPFWQTEITVHDLCPTIDLAGVGTAGDYVAGRPKRLRRALSRAVTRTGGGLDIETVTDTDRLMAVLPELQRIQEIAERADPKLPMFAPPWREFTLTALRAAFAGRGAVVVVTRLEGRAFSFGVAMGSRGRLGYWFQRFDPEAAAWSPGHVVLRGLLDWALANGYRELDLLLGDQEYKRTWTDTHYDTLSVLAAPVGRLASVQSRLWLREQTWRLADRLPRGRPR